MNDASNPGGHATGPDAGIGAGPRGPNEPEPVAARLVWRSGHAGSSTVAWQDWLDCDRHIDPYLVWGDLTAFAGMGGLDAVKCDMPLLVELTAIDLLLRDTSGQSGAMVSPPLALLRVTDAYKRAPAPAQVRAAARFITASTQLSSLHTLLSSSDTIVRFQLAAARLSDVERFEPRSYTEPMDTGQRFPRTVVAVIDDGCAFAHPQFQTYDAQAKAMRSRVQYLWDQDKAPRNKPWTSTPALGLFSYGSELAPATLAMPGADVPEATYYGGLDYAPLPLQPYALGTQANGFETYGALRPKPHGSAVLGIAAGRTPRALGGDQTRHLYTSPATQDSAIAWPLVFVQLPTRTTLDTSGGSLGAQVLDAVRYVIAQAENIAYEKDGSVLMAQPEIASAKAGPEFAAQLETLLKDFGILAKPNSAPGSAWRNRNLGVNVNNQIVVNISYGAMAGPHDGSSMVEEALAELVNLREGLHIVTAAGNAHRSQAHAALDLALGQPGVFTWCVGADNPLESYLEVWLPSHSMPSPRSGVAHEVPGNAHWGFHLRVLTPDGLSMAIHLGQARVLVDSQSAQQRPIAGVVFARKVAQGKNGTMVLIAVAPTRAEPERRTGDRPLGLHGNWQVEVCHVAGPSDASSDTRHRIHAWAERNDLVYGNVRRQQSTVFAAEQPPEPTEFTPRSAQQQRQPTRGDWTPSPEPYQLAYTLGSLAGGKAGSAGRKVLVAGAYRRGDGEPTPYSSGGPSTEPARTSRGATTRRESPDVDAPSDESVSVRGTRSAGMLAGGVTRLSGTSAAAPQVTRWLANLIYLVSHGLKSELPSFYCQTVDIEPAVQPPSSRPTPTPAGDDLYRKGKRRLK